MPFEPRLRLIAALVAPLLAATLSSGCAALSSAASIKRDTAVKVEHVKKGPESAPHRSITNFSAALRCMDNLMIEHGVRDVSVLVEDIVDQTKKVNAGTKDMLISAVSDMTRRSRAVRLVAFGQDSGNAIAFLQQAESKQPYSVIPQYDIKGSITQLDEDVIRKQGELGASIDPYLGIGIAKDAAANILGLDLTVLSTSDLSIIPGVTSRNAVVLFKEGSGYDADATIKKFGINFSLSLSKQEGQSQALRMLVELAAVELVGKLTHTPYWSCLGVNSETVEIEQEMGDWYYGLRANPPELIGYFQNQLRLRGLYQGPTDGVYTADVKDAAARYRTALGIEGEPSLDFALFKAHLGTRGLKTVAKLPEPAAKAASGANPLSLSVTAPNASKRFHRGEAFTLAVAPSADAHVYCYLEDETRSIRRFHPNRFNKDSFVAAAKPLAVPGEARFELVANDRGAKERIGCFATRADVAQNLPASVRGTDFEALPVASLNEVRTAFARVSGNQLAEGYFDVDVR